MTRHGVALVNLEPLLYPGATSISGAYFVKPYDTVAANQPADKPKLISLGAQILKSIVSGISKGGAGPEKEAGSRLSVASKKALDRGASQSDHHPELKNVAETTSKDICRPTDRQFHRQTDRQIDRKTDRQASRPTDRQTGTQTHQLTDRQTAKSDS